MADAIAPAPRKRSWLKILGLVLGILVLLVVVLYFVGTSSGFVRGVILPKVSKSMGADITASDVSLSPFKQIVIRDLKVQAPGREPLFTSPEVKVQYRLMDIIKGNYVIDLVSVASPVISLVQRPDATSNLDPIMDSLGKEEEKEEESQPMNLDLRKLVVTDGTLRYEQQTSKEGSLAAEITKLNVNIDGLKTGGVGKMTMDALMSVRSDAPAPGTNGSMAGTIKGALDLGLTPMLMPSVLKGNTRLEITEAKGTYAMGSGMAVVFDADVTATDVKQLALRLVQGQATLGEFAASGPFNMEKMEGTLDVRLSNVDRHALNLFTAGTGMNFNKTTISSTNRIQMSNGGQTFTAAGSFLVSNFQVTVTNQTSPVLNLKADYDVGVDQAASNAVVRALTLNGTQQGKQFLKGALTAPMPFNWGNPNQAVGDSVFSLTVDQFNLADWKAFMGDALDSGLLNSKVEVSSKQSGNQIGFTHDTRIENLGMTMGSNRVAGVAMVLSGDGESLNREGRFATKFNFELGQAAARALQATGSGGYTSRGEMASMSGPITSVIAEAHGDIKGTANVPELLRIAAVEDASFSSGAAQFNLALQQKGKAQQVLGDFALQNLTGRFGSNVFQNFAAVSKFDIATDDQKANIRKATIDLSQAGKPGGTVDVSGTYGLSNSAAQIKIALKDLNQNVLTTFLQPSMGEKKLTSIAVDGQSAVNYDPEKPSNITADFKMSNFVVNDPKGTVPAKPLEAGLAFETTINKEVAEIRKGVLTLTPTERAKNEVQLTGKIDMSDTNFTSGNIRIASDSMDVTTYYNIFQGQEAAEQVGTAAPGQPSTGSQPAPQPGPEEEAEPMILPLTNFVVETTIEKFYLSELEITNLVADTRINGGRVEINPFRMAINGAPLNSTVNLDMSVPGYRYDVLFGMTNVPFAPLVNTFAPERKGQMGGTISASTAIKGAGTTGASLQRNLNGYFNVETTNLNLSISEMRSPMLKAIINVIAIVPSIIKNPSSGLTSLAGALFGGSAAAGGNKPQGAWSDELLKSPIDVIAANAEMGSGRVNLQRAFIQSRAFQARAQGTIELAKVLTNSTLNIPLNISIARHLAESVSLVPPGTPTNAVYVQLPDYVAMKGTAGEPKTDINSKALIGTALQQYGGKIPGVDEKTGNLIQGLGGILTGRKATTNAPAGTNAPATNQSGSLLQGLGGILGGGTTSTNAGATNEPAANNPVGGLIQGILGPRKK